MSNAPTNTSSRNLQKRIASVPGWKIGAGVAGAALAGTALLNVSRARRAERENPPLGRFVTIDGVRLHFVERGQGPAIVLLHGNGTMIEDWIVSGVLDDLAKTNRVIAFDRPGFGHSERPRSRIWTPSEQAALIAQALASLGVARATVVAHSYGTLVALGLALDHREAVRSLVLLGGYYFPSIRADVVFASAPAIPVIGDVMRYTVSPLLGAALKPGINKKIFAPAVVPQRWEREFPFEMAFRPSQIRAEAAEAAIMIPAAAALAPRFAELDLPVAIVAGKGDKMVDPVQAERIHGSLAQSELVLIEGAGHMVHHSASEAVLTAIRANAAR